MNITSTQRTQNQPTPGLAPKTTNEKAPKAQEDLYTGPADRKSHPDLEWQAKARPWIKGLHSALVRKSPVKGLENLPMSGPHVYAPTHQSGIDPGLFFEIGVEDVRFMGAQEQFVGQQGDLFTKMGAFPVDRENPGTAALKHSKEILKEMKVGLLAFPEGGIFGDGSDGKVHPLKEGAAYMAILGGAESIVPVAIHVGEDKETRLGETALGTLAAAGVGAATMVAMAGGPVTRIVAGAVSGALFGAAASTTLFGKDTWNPYADAINETKIGTAGALVGGIVGGLTAGQFNSPWVGLAHGAASTTATLTAANAFIHRPVAKMEILKPLDVAAAVKEHGRKGARSALTGQIYDALSNGKHRLVFGEKTANA
jgi:1-acyl-sn-glycerol-3-phosphate acyltransferase